MLSLIISSIKSLRRWLVGRANLYREAKLILIKIVLPSVPLHILAILNPAQVVLKKIVRAFAHVFWCVLDGNQKGSWIAWSNISKPIGYGSLGIRSLREVIKALHGMLVWSVITSNSIFAQFLKVKYIKNNDVSSFEVKAYHSSRDKLLDNRWSKFCS